MLMITIIVIIMMFNRISGPVPSERAQGAAEDLEGDAARVEHVVVSVGVTMTTTTTTTSTTTTTPTTIIIIIIMIMIIVSSIMISGFQSGDHPPAGRVRKSRLCSCHGTRASGIASAALHPEQTMGCRSYMLYHIHVC